MLKKQNSDFQVISEGRYLCGGRVRHRLTTPNYHGKQTLLNFKRLVIGNFGV